MSIDYSKGKIYKLTGNGRTYIGSTTQDIKARYSHHKNNLTGSLREMMTKDFHIELIEDFPCNTKEELIEREKYYIQTTDCINQNLNINKTIRNRKENRLYNTNKKRKTAVYNMLPAFISDKLIEYIGKNPTETIEDICRRIINPEFIKA